MKQQDLVSVIIPTFNRLDLLRQAIDSALMQTWPKVEVIVVDDGSTDQTPRFLKEMISLHPERIKMIRLQNNGPGTAREAGRQAANGEFIQYLDSDDLLHPKKLERQIDALRRNPSADVACCITRLVDSQGTMLDHCLKWSGQTREALYPGLLVDRWWSTLTPLWRRLFCDQIGPWSDLRYSEDWEYEARAGALNARLIHVPEALCDVRVHDQHRETRCGRWLSPPDQVRFFQTLYDGAICAGVEPSCPEMLHFSRWVFYAARRAGCEGDPETAETLLCLAETISPKSCGLRAYRVGIHLFGHRKTARVTQKMKKLSGGKPGSKTLLQSWMKEGDPL